ncbi:hypothetical protein PHISCL_04879 [Aspergillus sclerotialis]|uniref:Uncharacterized protein n=1 Tax=Aspergillus sclerotialis TaxID=2070753 RepID=A0A3A2ZIA1_9EURO|nr:hypothetical protein PHISCL_04879 [Aspergillus sclerotialis]
MASRATSLLHPVLRSSTRPSIVSLRTTNATQSTTRLLSLGARIRPSVPALSPTLPKTAAITPTIRTPARTYSNGKSSGKSEGDLLVEELQELYEIATDEFEIATDSTNNATIYASSDRESARDALNQLQITYELYTTDVSSPEFQELQKKHADQADKQANVEGEASQVINTNFNPAEVSDEARAEVRKRVGQRVRELRNAVENLEERAMED